MPYLGETSYKEMVDKKGTSAMLTQLTVPTFGHCEFNAEQTANAFAALVGWVYTGRKPASDVIQ